MVRIMWCTCIILAAVLDKLVLAQYPQRLQIPDAVLFQSQEPLARPVVYRPQARVQQQLVESTSYFTNSSPRLRSRPTSFQVPANTIPIRPVVEEQEEDFPPQLARTSFLDDEVAKLGLNTLHTAINQADEEIARPMPPVRTIPILRQDIREQSQLRPITRQQQIELSKPTAAILRPVDERPVIRQELKQEQLYQTRPLPVQRQVLERDDPIPVAVRRPQPQVRVHQQPIRQQATPVRTPAIPRPAPQYLRDPEENGRSRTKKPPIKILRKYRTENEDGSISWGYENEDGTYKEEIIGTDCITRGMYGYVDPDGVRREYTYETGAKCDEPEEDDLDVLAPGGRQPLAQKSGGAVKRPATSPVRATQYQ